MDDRAKWWKNSIVYQIYPRSFFDSNNDGIGDLNGITEKLGYLKSLDIDVIWICPMYRSPNDDNGYDISDYQNIMEDFGTMEDFDNLLISCHKIGIKLIIDLVINHTSDEHIWFIESKSSSSNNSKRDWYIWRDNKSLTNSTNSTELKEPNNWASIFQGSAWKLDETTDSWFLHLFSERQPDLNWENPEVRQALYKMINWWLDKGIDGFRVDAISHIKKKKNLPNLPNPKNKGYGKYVPSFKYHMNVSGIDEYLTELAQNTFQLEKDGKTRDIMTVGEANGVKTEQAEFWVGEKSGIFNMIFQFEHLSLWQSESKKCINLVKLKYVLSKWQNKLEGIGWNALFIENHDQPRAVSIWGNDEYFWFESATCLATMYFFMKGTPFIYQGQEIGMTNMKFKNIHEFQDVASKNLFNELCSGKTKTQEEALSILNDCSRDHARTPMQWNADENAGFNSSSSSSSTWKSWIKVNPNTKYINVSSQEKQQENRQDSILSFYKKLIKHRKNNPVLLDGIYKLQLPRHKQIFAYTRQLSEKIIVVICNMSLQSVDLSKLNLNLNLNLTTKTRINIHQKDILLCNFICIAESESEYESGKPEQKITVIPPYGAIVYNLF